MSPGAKFEFAILLVKRIVGDMYFTATFDDCRSIDGDQTIIVDDSFGSRHPTSKLCPSTEKQAQLRYKQSKTK